MISPTVYCKRYVNGYMFDDVNGYMFDDEPHRVCNAHRVVSINDRVTCINKVYLSSLSSLSSLFSLSF